MKLFLLFLIFEKTAGWSISKFCFRPNGVFKMVDYSKIEEEIENMESGQNKPFGTNYTTDEFQGVYKFLLSLEEKGVISIKEHRESMSGYDLIDAAFVTKL